MRLWSASRAADLREEKDHPMRQTSTYLSFNGTAGEAMRFYEKVLGAKLDRLIKYGDLPPSPQTPPDSADKVLHAQVTFANGDVLMASDWVGGGAYEGMKGFSVTLDYESEQEAGRIFAALADKGHVLVPLQPSFFAKAFGMVIDRFGTPWMISGGAIEG
jgi:PhnB protein